MGLGQLANCPQCGKLFVKTIHDICPDCYKEIEEDYEKCVAYLKKKENRTANIYELSDGTGVSVSRITRFIREGRISVLGFPNLGYPCESCGKIIRKGHLCDDCANRLKKEWKLAAEDEKRLRDAKNKDYGGYYQVKEKFKEKD
ncbi:flagellar protein [Microaerobacter geothermalis]|uniref:TIGR03826 family flagellar region protein n=1 Tax=Microaerobacter geothermalis TaxID=674972 RepID=UPI001F4333DD|nr:TIGR03826 family flagellar region protein [Microaerobacter geothermalis]MCF6093411.1 flagellar protein [Microaerobacter geothermalis]